MNNTDMINFLTPSSSGENLRQKVTSLETGPNPPSVDFHYKLENLFFFETDNSSNVRKLWKYSWSPKENESKSRTKITDVGLKACFKSCLLFKNVTSVSHVFSHYITISQSAISFHNTILHFQQ